MEKPPVRMRKGFDRTLCAALLTTRLMLFTEFAITPPEKAPRVMMSADQVFYDGTGKTYAYPPQNVLSELVTIMRPAEVDELVRHAALLLLAKNDDRRHKVEMLLVNRAKSSIVKTAAFAKLRKQQKREGKP